LKRSASCEHPYSSHTTPLLQWSVDKTHLMVPHRSFMKVRSNSAMASFSEVFSSSEVAPFTSLSSMCSRSYASTCSQQE
jgi:hypothetical protein